MAAPLAFLEPAELPTDAVEVGRIFDAWGIKGALKIIPYSACPEALFSSKRWILLPPQARNGSLARAAPFTTPQLLKVSTAKEHGTSVVAQVTGLDDRSSAEHLKDCRIFVSRSAFPSTQANEYYWVDLIGCAVVNRDRLALGTVKDLSSSGAQTLLVVQRSDDDKTPELLIPFVSVYVDSVNLGERCITVDWQLDY